MGSLRRAEALDSDGLAATSSQALPLAQSGAVGRLARTSAEQVSGRPVARTGRILQNLSYAIHGRLYIPGSGRLRLQAWAASFGESDYHHAEVAAFATEIEFCGDSFWCRGRKIANPRSQWRRAIVHQSAVHTRPGMQVPEV